MLPTPEVCGSNPVIGNFFIDQITVNIEKKKRPGQAIDFSPLTIFCRRKLPDSHSRCVTSEPDHGNCFKFINLPLGTRTNDHLILARLSKESE